VRPRQARRRARAARWRGVGFRLLGLALGVVLGGGLIVLQALPAPPVIVRVHLDRSLLHVPSATPSAPQWPASGSAAVAVQTLGGSQTFIEIGPHQVSAPIASVTKMMTAWVAVRDLGNVTPTSGPCLTVTVADVAEYQADVATDQSHAAVQAGERLCAYDLLAGLLVHSANNYATLLARLVTTSQGVPISSFLSAMNNTARSLAMNQTHYVDFSGLEPGSRSTAADQLRLALQFMKNPLLRSLVARTSVRLPVAGVVGTYTPLLGRHGVIGIKSGRTGYAGGCDVLALRATRAGTASVVYAVVTNQFGGDVLAQAGAAAYRLAQSVLPSMASFHWRRGTPAGVIRWGQQRLDLAVIPVAPLRWWGHDPPHVLLVRVARSLQHVQRGEVIAVIVRASDHTVLARIVSVRASQPVPWWHRLR
jgi:D-alanyl-D-alanine carboxypeptidase